MLIQQQIQSFVEQVAIRFRPMQVILFGSHAYGEPTEDSDVDLMVLMRHRGPSAAIAGKIRLACPREFPMDLIVRTPAEIRRQLGIGDPFLSKIIEHGVVLYEADNATVG